MYTWGYIKENTLSKMDITEKLANEQGFLKRFPYCANEAMTQICSAIKPKEQYFEITVKSVNQTCMFPDDFIAFSDNIILYAPDESCDFVEVGDEDINYVGYNCVSCRQPGIYRIPYKARWFFFTPDLENDVVIPAPADICEAIPSYIVSQCLKVDDELKAAVYRNEFEMFLARIDDTNFKSQRTFKRGGGW